MVRLCDMLLGSLGQSNQVGIFKSLFYKTTSLSLSVHRSWARKHCPRKYTKGIPHTKGCEIRWRIRKDTPEILQRFPRIRVLNRPENYNPTTPGRRVFKPEPDAARHSSMNCLPEPGLNPTPHVPALFSSYTCYRTQRRQVCICPSPWSNSQTYSSPHVNSYDSQQTIHNLQLSWNVSYKKGCLRPLICVFFRPDLLRTI